MPTVGNCRFLCRGRGGMCFDVVVLIKVKQSPYRPGVGQKVPGS